MRVRRCVLVLFVFLAGSLVGVSPAPADVLDDLTKWEEGRGMCASSARLGDDGLPDPEGNVDCDRIVEPGETVVIAELQGPGVITVRGTAPSSARPYQSSRG